LSNDNYQIVLLKMLHEQLWFFLVAVLMNLVHNLSHEPKIWRKDIRIYFFCFHLPLHYHYIILDSIPIFNIRTWWLYLPLLSIVYHKFV
jgi:hypothetical protein